MGHPTIPMHLMNRVVEVTHKVPQELQMPLLDLFAEYGAELYTIGCKDALTLALQKIDAVNPQAATGI